MELKSFVERSRQNNSHEREREIERKRERKGVQGSYRFRVAIA